MAGAAVNEMRRRGAGSVKIHRRLLRKYDNHLLPASPFSKARRGAAGANGVMDAAAME